MRVGSLGQEDTLRRLWPPTPVFLPGESHRRRGLAGYSPWGRKELDITELLIHTHTHTPLHGRIWFSLLNPSTAIRHEGHN